MELDISPINVKLRIG